MKENEQMTQNEQMKQNGDLVLLVIQEGCLSVVGVMGIVRIF